MTVSTLDFSFSYYFKKSCIYLFWVRGNFVKGRMGELNFITYILRRGPMSVEGSFSSFLVRFLGAGGVSPSARGTFRGRPRVFLGGSSGFVEKPLVGIQLIYNEDNWVVGP
jgi:hypothetical protein